MDVEYEFISELDENSPRMDEIGDNLNQIWTKTTTVDFRSQFVLGVLFGCFISILSNVVRDFELEGHVPVVVVVAGFALLLYH